MSAPAPQEEAFALIGRIAARDEDALAAFYRTFQSRVYAFAMIRLNDPAAASDLVNEVMMEVWRSADRFEGRSSVAAWLRGITRHKILDELRRRGRHAHEELDPEMPEEDDASAVDALTALESDEDLEYCIGRLPLMQREAIHLAFFEDLSYAEIAELTGAPEGTVKTRVHHAKKSLKRCLTARFRRSH